MKKWFVYLSALFIMIIGLPGLIYLGLAIYYQDTFMYGVWINGIYCTGKTVEEADRELSEKFEFKEVKVITDQGTEILKGEDFEFTFDFKASLEEYRKKQNPFNWYAHILTDHKNEEIFPQISFQEELLDEWIFHTAAYQDDLDLKEDSLSIVLTEEGYRLKEEKERILNIVLVKEKIKEAVSMAKEEVNLEEEGCYFTREETLKMQETRKLFEENIPFVAVFNLGKSATVSPVSQNA